MLNTISRPFLGFLQATGLVVYILLITAFLQNVPQIFQSATAEFYAPIIMLLLFVISAVISASIVLGRPGVLFWERKYNEAFGLVGWTVGWSLMYFLLLVLILYISQ